MLKLLFLSACIASLHVTEDTCTSKVLDQLYKKNFYSNYLLCLPVEVSGKKGRIILDQKAFKKYMMVLDSSFADDQKLKKHVGDILSKKSSFFFYQIVYEEKVGQTGYHLLFKPNNLIRSKSSEKKEFLRRYILRYNESDKDLIFNTSTPSANFYYAVEALFKMNYLVAISDGEVMVKRIFCK